MVYKKFIKKNGKKFGPYYFKSVRTKDGKIKSVYLGTEEPNKFSLPTALLIGVFFVIFALAGYFSYTGLDVADVVDLISEEEVSSDSSADSEEVISEEVISEEDIIDDGDSGGEEEVISDGEILNEVNESEIIEEGEINESVETNETEVEINESEINQTEVNTTEINQSIEINESVEINESIGGIIIPLNLSLNESNVSGNLTNVSFNISGNLSNISSNVSLINISDSGNETTFYYNVTINQPVKWEKRIKLNKETINLTIKLPGEANITSVKEIKNNVETEIEFEEIGDIVEEESDSRNLITGNVVRDIEKDIEKILKFLNKIFSFTGLVVYEEKTKNNDKEIKIGVPLEEVKVEYLMPGPVSEESYTDNFRKIITISSEEHYVNILAYTNLSDVNLNSIRLYHLVNDSKKEVSFDAYDLNENGLVDYIEWIVPSLSNETYEVSITILNVQSYPMVGGNWTVMFNTTGEANLTIRTIEGTEWSNENENYDLKFLEVRCGDNLLDYSWVNDSVFISDYSCNETGYEFSKVLTSGGHYLEFNYGGQVAYANNTAYNYSGGKLSGFEKLGIPNSLDNYTSQASSSAYTNLTASDDSHWVTDLATSDGEYDSQIFVFNTTDIYFDNLTVTWEGYGETQAGYYTNISFWNWTGSQWYQVNATDFTSAADQTLYGFIGSGINNFINSSDKRVAVLVSTRKYVVVPFSGMCYQETADGVHGSDGSCTLDYNGIYDCSAGWDTTYTCANTYDGNWGTYGYAGATDSYLSVNYTKPVGATYGSLWQIGHIGYMSNLTISNDCFDQSKLQFLVGSIKWGKGYVKTQWSCYNGTSWELIYENAPSGISYIMEEAMWWNISSSPFLYFYNDKKYEFLSDFIPGATSEKDEYLSFIDISKLDIYDNKIKLKITEELDETTYLDRIYLKADDGKIIELDSINENNYGFDDNIINKILLSKSDNNYLIMNQGDEYYLEFDAPKEYKKIEFAAEGYYIEHYKKNIEKPHNTLYTDYIELNSGVHPTPNIAFSEPTPANATTTLNTSFIINVSINDSDDDINQVVYNWNGTNHSLYDDNLVLMYNFDNVSALGENIADGGANSYLIDLSGYNNSGSSAGGYQIKWNSSGKYGGAGRFATGIADDGIQVNDSDSLKPANITIAAWVYPEGWQAYASVVSKMTDGTWTDGYMLGSIETNNDIKFWVNNYTKVANGTLTLNQWMYLTGVYNGTTVMLYIDGVLVDSSAYSDGITHSNSILQISQHNLFVTGWVGLIDEVRIWNKSLSPDEIQFMYKSNLNKYDSGKWNLNINQTKNATSVLDKGNYTYQAFAIDSFSTTNSTEVREITIGDFDSPTITLESPDTGYVTISPHVSLTCNATDNGNLNNISLYTNQTGSWMLNQSIGISGNSSVKFNLTNMSNIGFIWNCLAYDGGDNSDWGDSNWTVNIINRFRAYEKLGMPTNNGDFDSEALEEDYNALNSTDTSRWQTDLSTDSGIESQIFVYYSNFAAADIDELYVRWEGYGPASVSEQYTNITLENFVAEGWTQFDAIDFDEAKDQNLIVSTTSPTNYVEFGTNKITAMVYTREGAGLSGSLNTNYIVFETRVAPDISSGPILVPEPARLYNNLNCTFTLTDKNNASIIANYTWYQDGTPKLSGQQNVSNNTAITIYLGSGNISNGENWTCGIIPYDGSVYGAGANSSDIYVTNVVGCGMNITRSGNYVVNGSVSDYNNMCIVIDSSNVNLDCKNYVLDGTISGDGVYSSRTSGNELTNISIRNCHFNDFNDGVNWNYVDQSYIYNVSADNTDVHGFIIWNSDYNYFDNLTATGNTYEGFSTSAITYNNFTNLTFHTNSRDGIVFSNSDFNIVKDSRFYANDRNGLYLSGSDYNTFYNLTIEDHSGTDDRGIYSFSGNDYNNFSDSIIRDNYDGILSNGSFNNNNFTRMNITNNSNYGIYFSVSTDDNNFVYDNFFNNSNNTLTVNGADNFWNTSKKVSTNIIGGSFVAGNYWADLTGTGWSDNCTDTTGDGICEDAYNLSGFNVDYKPLTYKTNLISNISSGPVIAPSSPNTTNILNCTFTIVDDINTTLIANYTWYNSTGGSVYEFGQVEVANGTFYVLNLTNTSDTYKQQEWICGIIPYDGISYGDGANSTSVQIQNTPPPAPTLVAPANESTIVSRTPDFSWNNVTDPDGDSTTFEIWVDDDSGFVAREVEVSGIQALNYTIQDWKTLDLDTVYYWKVRASDGTAGNWSGVRNFQIESTNVIQLNQGEINFGQVDLGVSENTTDDNPLPFEIENAGNIIVNVSINASQLFNSVPLDSENYRYKVDTVESDSFNTSNSLIVFTNFVADLTNSINDLLFANASDSAEFDVLALVPTDEIAGTKISEVYIFFNMSE